MSGRHSYPKNKHADILRINIDIFGCKTVIVTNTPKAGYSKTVNNHQHPGREY